MSKYWKDFATTMSRFRFRERIRNEMTVDEGWTRPAPQMLQSFHGKPIISASPSFSHLLIPDGIYQGLRRRDLDGTEYRVILSFLENDKATPVEIMLLSGLSMAATKRALSSLEKKGIASKGRNYWHFIPEGLYRGFVDA